MGVLQGIGDFASGAAKGVEIGSQIAARAAATRASSEEAERKATDYANSQNYQTILAKIADPEFRIRGDMSVADIAATSIEELQKGADAVARAHTPGARLGALAGKLGITRKETRDVAAAAGVTPVGLPRGPGGPPTPPMPGAAPAAPGAEPTVDAIDIPGQPGRAMTPKERAQFRSIVAHHYKQKEDAYKAADEYKNLEIGDQLKAIDILPFDQLGPRLGKLSGQDIDIIPNKDDPDRADIYLDNKLYKSGADRAYIHGMAKEHLEDNPEAGWQVMQAAQKDQFDVQGKKAEIEGIRARTAEVRARIKQLEDIGPVQSEAAKIELGQLKQKLADDAFLAVPSNAIEHREEWDAARQRQAGDRKDPRYWRMTQRYDDKSDKVITDYEDVKATEGAQEVAFYENSEHRKAGRIGKEVEDGVTYYRVMDPGTGKPAPQRFRSFRDADAKAEKLWNPKRDVVVPAAGGKPGAVQRGKTVARVPNVGLGVNEQGRAKPIPAGP
jgi:hypothetical protein